MKTFLIFVVAGCIGWVLWGIGAQKIEIPHEVTLVVAKATPAGNGKNKSMATTGVRYVTPSQIAVVRGRVVSLNEGMMVVDCEPDPEAQGGFAVDLGAGAGAAASEAMAKWAITSCGQFCMSNTMRSPFWTPKLCRKAASRSALDLSCA